MTGSRFWAMQRRSADVPLALVDLDDRLAAEVRLPGLALDEGVGVHVVCEDPEDDAGAPGGLLPPLEVGAADLPLTKSSIKASWLMMELLVPNVLSSTERRAYAAAPYCRVGWGKVVFDMTITSLTRALHAPGGFSRQVLGMRRASRQENNLHREPMMG